MCSMLPLCFLLLALALAFTSSFAFSEGGRGEVGVEGLKEVLLCIRDIPIPIPPAQLRS